MSTLKNELKAIVSGKSPIRHGTLIQTITNLLDYGQRTGPKTEIDEQIKKQEEKELIHFIDRHLLWIDFNPSTYISRGAEQAVFLLDERSVLKLNDGIYYSSKRDYFINLLLHNYFFPDTAYELVGFAFFENRLCSAVKQPFVQATELTNQNILDAFLQKNGFNRVRNHDYYHDGAGIILEDLHDENVLSHHSFLYFIDTVFYLDLSFFDV